MEKKKRWNRMAMLAGASLLLAGTVPGAGAHGVEGRKGSAQHAAFDIVGTDIRVDAEKNWVEFSMQVSGKAGSVKPRKTGTFAGAQVFSYVWPTRIDPVEVGFERGAGLLALAVTVHPDFDDTPLFATTGADWHSHWVVLGPDTACGPAALKVIDIPAGSKPKLPKTWPGVPLLIDSPGYAPRFAGNSVTVRVPFDDVGSLKGVAFDGVTAGLQVNANLHAPLLCVSDVFDVASGNLSLPGAIE
jgi:hypothetical protein